MVIGMNGRKSNPYESSSADTRSNLPPPHSKPAVLWEAIFVLIQLAAVLVFTGFAAWLFFDAPAWVKSVIPIPRHIKLQRRNEFFNMEAFLPMCICLFSAVILSLVGLRFQRTRVRKISWAILLFLLLPGAYFLITKDLWDAISGVVFPGIR